MSYDADEAIRKMRESSIGRKGGNWVDKLLKNMAAQPLIEEKDIPLHHRAESITDARLYVLAVLAAGGSIAQIAREEGVSRATVADRLKMAKYVLGAKTTPHAIAIAIRKGIL